MQQCRSNLPNVRVGWPKRERFGSVSFSSSNRLPKIALPVSTANPVTFAPGHARLATNPQYRLRSVARFRVARRCEPIQGKSAAYKPIPITPRNTGATRRFIFRSCAPPTGRFDGRHARPPPPRRYPERPDCWHVYYGGVHAGC
jgi:hypothetical protein